jgi:hypothetical protein
MPKQQATPRIPKPKLTYQPMVSSMINIMIRKKSEDGGEAA